MHHGDHIPHFEGSDMTDLDTSNPDKLTFDDMPDDLAVEIFRANRRDPLNLQVWSSYSHLWVKKGSKDMYANLIYRITPKPAPKIEVGYVYTSKSGQKWHSIYAEGEFVWLTYADGFGSAYVFKKDGSHVCLSGDDQYTIDMSIPPVPYEEYEA